MSDPAQLSVSAVVALVLGGVAAFVLALLVALGGYGHSGAKKGSTASSAQPRPAVAPATSGDLKELEAEYPLDWNEPAQVAGGPGREPP